MPASSKLENFASSESELITCAFEPSNVYIQSESNDETAAASAGNETETQNSRQNDEQVPSNAEFKTIPLHEYIRLVQLIPEVAKLKDLVKRLEDTVKIKNEKLKELQNAYTRENKMNSNLSSLTDVNFGTTSLLFLIK